MLTKVKMRMSIMNMNLDDDVDDDLGKRNLMVINLMCSKFRELLILS